MIEPAGKRMAVTVRPEASHLIGAASVDERIEFAAPEGLAERRPERPFIPVAETEVGEVRLQHAGLPRVKPARNSLAHQAEVDIHRPKGAHQVIKSVA